MKGGLNQMKETKIEEKIKPSNEKYLKILSAEVLENNVYRYTMISNVPFFINETLML